MKQRERPPAMQAESLKGKSKQNRTKVATAIGEEK